MPAIPPTIADELLPLIFRRQRRSPLIGNDLPEQGGYTGQLPRPNILSGAGGQGVALGTPAQEPAPPVVVPSGANPSQLAMQEEVRPRRAAVGLAVGLADGLGTPRSELRSEYMERLFPYGSNLLAQEPSVSLPEETRPRQVTQPGMPSPVIPSQTIPQSTIEQPAPMMDESAMRPARRVETDKRGRPTPNITLQGDEQTLDYQDRLARMPEDKEGGGWWPKIRAAIAGFAAGGPVGAAAGFGTRALREHFDPTLGSREYKAEQMRQNAPAVEQIRQARKDKLDKESKVASTDLAKARAEALKNPRASGRIVERKDGVYMIDVKTGKAEKIAGIPAEAGTPGSTRYISRADGVYGINADHPNGFKVSGIPGNAGKDVEDVTFGNAQIQRAISEAEAEQAKIDSALNGTPYTDKDGKTHAGTAIPATIQSTDILGNPRTVANPEYTYNMTRRRQLDDDIRNWRQKLKSPKKSAAGKTLDPLGLFEDDNDEP